MKTYRVKQRERDKCIALSFCMYKVGKQCKKRLLLAERVVYKTDVYYKKMKKNVKEYDRRRRIYMSKYAGTETEENLKKAFAGESQARNKYTYFASAARKNGFV